MEDMVATHGKPQKAPKMKDGDAPGVIQVRPHVKIGGGRGPPKKADRPPSEASDDENGDQGSGEGDAPGNDGNADGNGGNGGDGGSDSDSSDSSMHDDGQPEIAHPPEEEKKGPAQPEEEKKRPPRSQLDQMYLLHEDRMEGYAKMHQIVMAAIKADAERVHLSKINKMLQRRAFKTLRKQKRERKSAMKDVKFDIDDQMLDSSDHSSSSSSLSGYKENLYQGMQALHDHDMKVAMKLQKAEKEPAEHELQNHRSIEHYWRQVLIKAQLPLNDREQGFWERFERTYKEFGLRMSDNGVQMAPSRQ